MRPVHLSAFLLTSLLALHKCPYVEYNHTCRTLMLSITIKVQQKLCSMAPSHKTRPSVMLDRLQRHLLVNIAVGGNMCPIEVLDGWER
jgi:hypothetical protein